MENDRVTTPNGASTDHLMKSPASTTTPTSTTTKNTSTGLESYLVGISPAFWAHVPMSIADILHNTDLTPDGINCLSVTFGNVDNHDDNGNGNYNGDNMDKQRHKDEIEQSMPRKKQRRIPVSKCLLVGCIVSMTTQSDGSFTFILDDGTGIVDCISWFHNNNNFNDDEFYDINSNIFRLPNLLCDKNETKTNNNNNNNYSKYYKLGDLVRVFGKIKCLANVKVVGSNETTRNEKRPFDDMIREIDVISMETVTSHASLSRLPSSMSILDIEARHWLKSMQWMEQNSNDSNSNSLTYLETLGPDIQSQIFQRQTLPSASTAGAWRVFGMYCQCNLPYKDHLLYCHCQARPDKLDPQLIFRDAMLTILMDMEANKSEKLIFQYREIRNNPELQQVGNTLNYDESKIGNQRKDILLDRLFRNTFLALRKDGILHLQDENKDLYLFITRQHVLEPHVRSVITRHKAKLSSFLTPSDSKPKSSVYNYYEGVDFLSKVHQERILFLQRSVLKEAESDVLRKTGDNRGLP